MKTNEIRKHELGCQWIRPNILFTALDCCDSMHECKELEARFLEITNDKETIQQYVTNNLESAWRAELECILKEFAYEDIDLQNTPSEMLFPL